MDIKIIVAAHKQYKMPDSKMYIPLQVGAKGKPSIGYVRDDKGDNISDKNPTYCELTGMYYAWKNMDAEYLGLVHYRRYFASNATCSDKDPFLNVLTPEEVRYYMSGYDIIVPNKRKYYIESLYSHYDHTFDGRHLKVAYSIIAKHYPEYQSSCDKVYRRTWGYMFNMFITNKKLWDEYCTWLFDILGRMEDYIDLSKYDAFESRLFGRISEILFNVWLEYKIEHGLKAVEVKCIHMEPVDWITKGTAFLKAKFFGHKYTKSF
ncbi:MAG: DUF4422 domain-containing protein [Lachnospiraceae bacterium]|nr:DUF4422 domain-containing protein [Lachnospiraceae bacterium]